MIRAVLFDLDGTLLNRDESVKKFIADQHDRFNEWVGHISKEYYISRFIELDCRGYAGKDKVYQKLVAEFKIQGVKDKDLHQDYLSEFKHRCIPFPNLVTMLEELRSENILLGIITNGKGEFQMDSIKALGIEEYFDIILVSEWEGIKKPNPQIFMKALQLLNLLPNECVFVGDHPENDVSAAKHVGMKGIWKKDTQWDHADADFIIDDLADIPIIIKEAMK